jgi:hypothetical protein
MVEQGRQAPEPLDEEGDQAKKKRRKKRRGRDFWLTWLRSREDDDGGREDETTAAGRLRAGFLALSARFFERNVAFEVAEEQTTARREQSEDTANWWPTIESVEESAASDREKPLSDVISTTKADVADGDSIDGGEKCGLDSDADISSAATVQQELPEQTVPEQTDEPSGQGFNATAEPYAEKPLMGRPVEQSKLVGIPTSGQETPAAFALAGLGLERRGRQRPKSEQIRPVNTIEQKAAAPASHDEAPIKKPSYRNKAEAALPKAARPAVPPPEPRPESPRQPINSQERVVSTKEAPEIAQIKRAVAEEVAKKVDSYERRQEAPAVVLQEMVRAAEADVPVERIYERRQEVKDKPVGYSSTQAVPVAAVLKDMVKDMAPPAVRPAAGGHEQASAAPRQQSRGGARLYRQAAQQGFWAAIVILVLALIAYLFA